MTGSARSQSEALDRLRDAEARFRLGRLEGSRDVISAAVELLMAGVKLQEVAVLAGDDRADDRELEQDLEHALTALGIDALTLEAAGLRLATLIAAEVVAGRGDLRAAAGNVWDIWLAANEPDRLADFAITADGFHDVPDLISETQFREAAVDFLAQAPGG